MSPGDFGASGNQASADPPEHVESEDNEARLRVDDWNGDRPPRRVAHQEPREDETEPRASLPTLSNGAKAGVKEPRDEPAREPAPADANPLGEKTARDRRTREP